MPTHHPILSLSNAGRARFYSKINIAGLNDCHEWLAAISSCGYGLFRAFSYDSMIHAHRVAYALHHNVELPPKDMKSKSYVLHTCHNRKCCNPNHLYLGSHQDNMDDMNKAGRGVFIGKPPIKKGEAHHKAVLTEDIVSEIRRLAAESLPATDLIPRPRGSSAPLTRKSAQFTTFTEMMADKYHVSKDTIYDILKRRSWTHLPPSP